MSEKKLLKTSEGAFFFYGKCGTKDLQRKTI